MKNIKYEDITFETFLEIFSDYIIYVKYNDSSKSILGEITISPHYYLYTENNKIYSVSNYGSPLGQYEDYFKNTCNNIYLIPLSYKDSLINDSTRDITWAIIQENIKNEKFIKLK